ncbi:unnamed protein product [Allacma fusca]|uniref:long-chain-fatty-acid--CoA ligase n=1 Tax=Allacma fusca TaxID=39272 RepID=A0A8J2JR66_9HEXA|nr:unnamed protein product [Allacma fusca]
MALLLICRRASSSPGALNGIRFAHLPVIYASDALRHNVRYIRTSGVGNEPYDTAQVRKNSASASLAIPQIRDIEEKHRDVGAIALESTHNKKDFSLKNEALKEKVIIQALTFMTKTFDVLTLPLYAVLHQPWKKQALNRGKKAVLVDEARQEWGSREVFVKSPIHEEFDQFNIDTLDKLFTRAIEKHGDRKCLGSREVLGVHEVEDHMGKLVKKYDLGEYNWLTYTDLKNVTSKLNQGMRHLGLKPKQRIAIFAETRAEWLVTAVAAFQLNLPIVTVFATLGDEGVIHALNETEVTCLFTSEELMGRCSSIAEKVPCLANVVCINSSKDKLEELSATPFPKRIQLNSLSSLASSGESQLAPEESMELKPQREDTAIIMYTSGSTGVPKGVVISHWNLVCALKAITDSLASFGDPREDDCYIAYLPLAHALELLCEAMCLLQGVQIGYSSPLTLTDKSLAVKDGCKGDATLLKPTVLGSVPLVLERILKGIQMKISERGNEASIVFDFFSKYKINWTRLGYETPLVDRIFFKPIRELVGGKVRLVICGGAPLAVQTHEFMRALLGCPVLQGYGLTETTASGLFSIGEDLTAGRVGGPITCTNIRLINWEEGGYRVTDKPYPRGEIYLGGDNVAMGYFKKPESTDFFVENGKRWVQTGDIAEVHPDGAFRIIDRKKDLVKLSSGEYISLGKIESILKTSPFVENLCVYADPYFSYPVAVVVTSQAQVESVAAKLGKGGEKYVHLVKDPVIVKAVLSAIQKQANLLKLEKHEIPQQIHICPEIWMPQSGLVTAAFKIKRNNVYKQFHQEIQDMLRNA